MSTAVPTSNTNILKHHIDRATNLASSDADPGHSTQALSQALRDLMRWRSELADDDLFASQAQSLLGLTEKEARELVRDWEPHQSLLKKVAKRWASIPHHEIDTKRLEIEFSSYMESAECRADVTRPKSSRPKADLNNPWAPFLESLRRAGVFSMVRAETMARLSAYIRSGHAALDLGNTPSDQHNVLALRALMDDIRQRKDVPARKIDAIISARLDDVCVPVRVRTIQLEVLRPDGTVEPVEKKCAQQVERSSFSIRDDKSEGPGCIDVAVRDARRPGHWLLCAATSNEDTESQGAQNQIHQEAVRNSMAIGEPPFDEAQSFEFTFAAPAITSRSFRKRWGENGAEPSMSPEEERAVNIMALYRQVYNSAPTSHSSPLNVYRSRFAPFGALATQPPDQRASDFEVVSFALKEMIRAARFFARSDVHLERINAANEKQKSTETPLHALFQSIDGLLIKVNGPWREDVDANLLKELVEPLTAIAKKTRVHFEDLRVHAKRIVGSILIPDEDAPGAELKTEPMTDDPIVLNALREACLAKRQRSVVVRQKIEAGNDEESISFWENASQHASDSLWRALVRCQVSPETLTQAAKGKPWEWTKTRQTRWLKDFMNERENRCKLFDVEPYADRMKRRSREMIATREKWPSATDGNREVIGGNETEKEARCWEVASAWASGEVWEAVKQGLVSIHDVADLLDTKKNDPEAQNQWLESQHGVNEVLRDLEKTVSQFVSTSKRRQFLTWCTRAAKANVNLFSKEQIKALEAVAHKASANIRRQIMKEPALVAFVVRGQNESPPLLSRTKRAQNLWWRERKNEITENPLRRSPHHPGI